MYQAYHPGWLAYSAPSNNWLANQFPVLFASHIQNHTMVNNWANGWEFNPKKNTIIHLIYWPQYLEYFGFAILFAIIGLFIIKNNVLKRAHSVHK
jgi:hypothetical protein